MEPTVPTLIDATMTLFMLQRWNSLPRVEIWYEAENVAYCAHMGLALGVCADEDVFPNYLLRHFLIRCLLKSLNKHTLSDVSYHVKETLGDLLKKDGDNNTEPDEFWRELTDKLAVKISRNLFPREIKFDLAPYLKGHPEKGDLKKKEWEKIECLCRYVQLKSAYQECETN